MFDENDEKISLMSSPTSTYGGGGANGTPLSTTSTSIAASASVHVDPFTKRIQSESYIKYPSERTTSPTFAILESHGLFTTAFLKKSFHDIFEHVDLSPTSTTKARNMSRQWCNKAHCCSPTRPTRTRTPSSFSTCFGGFFFQFFHKEVIVPPGHICCLVNDDNDYIFAKPGIHVLEKNSFLLQMSDPIPLYFTPTIPTHHQRSTTSPLDNSNNNNNNNNTSTTTTKTQQRTCYIQHGNRFIITIPQGSIALLSDMGSPILLPPGLHSWTSETMQLERVIPMDSPSSSSSSSYSPSSSPILSIGPFTILTIEEGHVGVTTNNGKYQILNGGSIHLLTNASWKLKHVLNMKMRYTDLTCTATSADNIVVSIDSIVIWRIIDPILAVIEMESPSSLNRYGGSRVGGVGGIGGGIGGATAFSDHYSHETGDAVQETIQNNFQTKLTTSTLKQAKVAIARFVSKIHLAESMFYNSSAHRAALLNDHQSTTDDMSIIDEESSIHVHSVLDSTTRKESNPMLDTTPLMNELSQINLFTSSNWGIEIHEIQITSSHPVDTNITSSLTANAVSIATTLQSETQAISIAKALQIETDATIASQTAQAKSEASTTLIRAKAEAEASILRADGQKTAELLRAEGVRDVASLLESSNSKVAVRLEMIKASAEAIRENDKFFFAQEPSFMPHLTLNAGDSTSTTRSSNSNSNSRMTGLKKEKDLNLMLDDDHHGDDNFV